jgi:hypothetical protein
MRLREFIEKKTQEELRGDLIRAIDLSKDTEDMMQAVALITSASQELDNDTLIFVQDYFDKKWGAMRSQVRSVQ